MTLRRKLLRTSFTSYCALLVDIMTMFFLEQKPLLPLMKEMMHFIRLLKHSHQKPQSSQEIWTMNCSSKFRLRFENLCRQKRSQRFNKLSSFPCEWMAFEIPSLWSFLYCVRKFLLSLVLGIRGRVEIGGGSLKESFWSWLVHASLRLFRYFYSKQSKINWPYAYMFKVVCRKIQSS